jgi:hypothetical protein
MLERTSDAPLRGVFFVDDIALKRCRYSILTSDISALICSNPWPLKAVSYHYNGAKRRDIDLLSQRETALSLFCKSVLAMNRGLLVEREASVNNQLLSETDSDNNFLDNG